MRDVDVFLWSCDSWKRMCWAKSSIRRNYPVPIIILHLRNWPVTLFLVAIHVDRNHSSLPLWRCYRSSDDPPYSSDGSSPEQNTTAKRHFSFHILHWVPYTKPPKGGFRNSFVRTWVIKMIWWILCSQSENMNYIFITHRTGRYVPTLSECSEFRTSGCLGELSSHCSLLDCISLKIGVSCSKRERIPADFITTAKRSLCDSYQLNWGRYLRRFNFLFVLKHLNFQWNITQTFFHSNLVSSDCAIRCCRIPHISEIFNDCCLKYGCCKTNSIG